MQEEKIQPHLSENVITVITDPNELRSLNINGDYGLSYQIDGTTVAVSGFRINQRTMHVDHLAQGKRDLPRKIRRKLMQLDGRWRDELCQALVNFAEQQGLENIVITSARNHPKVISDEKYEELSTEQQTDFLPYTRAVEIIDEVAKRNDFMLNENGDYTLDI